MISFRDLLCFHSQASDLGLFKASFFLSIFIPHRIADLLLYPHASRHLSYSSDLSNPAHHCPFISPPAEFIILHLIIPSTRQLFVFCSFKDREPSILSQYPRHYVFPSIYLFLTHSLSPLLSLAVHLPRALFSVLIYTFPRQYVLLIQPPALGTALAQPLSREAGGVPGRGKRGGQRYEATHSSEMEKKRQKENCYKLSLYNL